MDFSGFVSVYGIPTGDNREPFEHTFTPDGRVDEVKDHLGNDPYPGCGGVSQELWDNMELARYGWNGKEYDIRIEKTTTQREFP